MSLLELEKCLLRRGANVQVLSNRVWEEKKLPRYFSFPSSSLGMPSSTLCVEEGSAVFVLVRSSVVGRRASGQAFPNRVWERENLGFISN